MKASFIALLAITFFNSCNNNTQEQKRDPSSISSFEVYAGDTCNRTDVSGRKQGKWYLHANNNYGKIIDTVYYKDGKVIE